MELVSYMNARNLHAVVECSFSNRLSCTEVCGCGYECLMILKLI